MSIDSAAPTTPTHDPALVRASAAGEVDAAGTVNAGARRTIRVSAVVIRNAAGHVLNVRKRGTTSLMLPGGKPEPGEDSRATAVREIAEELGLALDPARLRDLGVFRAAAANEPGCVVEAAVFEHPLVPGAEAAAPRAEIEHVEWVDPAVTRPDMAPLNTDVIFPALLAEA